LDEPSSKIAPNTQPPLITEQQFTGDEHPSRIPASHAIRFSDFNFRSLLSVVSTISPRSDFNGIGVFCMFFGAVC
jgi:hypothetical protein